MDKLNKKQWTLINTHNIINILVSELDLSEREIKDVFNKVLDSQKSKREDKYF